MTDFVFDEEGVSAASSGDILLSGQMTAHCTPEPREVMKKMQHGMNFLVIV